MKSYQVAVFGKWRNQEVLAYRFENEQGYQLRVMTYGATILEYVTPDQEGHFTNVVLGFDRFEDYVGNSPKYGASIGPVAGRIAGASFELNGQTYNLEKNSEHNCNHSGSTGWDSALFQVESVTDQGLTLYTERADGTGGFPGNLKVWVTYSLSEEGALEIAYRVETDQDTLVNPTNHSYFNLSGNFTQPIDDHVFQINHQGLYPIQPDGVPLQSIERDSPLVHHLSQAMRLADLFQDSDPQVRLVEGLDHPFALAPNQEQAGFLYHQPSGRFLTFQSEAPTLVVYSANFVDDSVHLDGKPMVQHNGLALEFQTVPDAIHSEEAEKVILRAGQVFTSNTRYHALVKTQKS